MIVFAVQLSFCHFDLSSGIEPGIRYLSYPEINESSGSSVTLSGYIEGEHNIKGNFFTGLGLGFVRKGYSKNESLRDDFGNYIDEGKVFANLDYLTIPLRIGFKSNGKVSYRLYSGVFTGFLLHQNSENINAINFNGFDFGFVFGAGTHFRIKENSRLGIDLIQNRGLVSVTPVDVSRTLTNTFGLRMSYIYRL